MLAKPQKHDPTRISVRYYLWSSEGLLRITECLHRALFNRHVAMPQFAGTKQKVMPRRTTVLALEAIWREQHIEFESLGDGGFQVSFRSPMFGRMAKAKSRRIQS